MSIISESILKGAKEALDYAKSQKKKSRAHKVNVPQIIDVREIRNHLHMTREKFSNMFGFSVRTLEKWERHERKPDTSAGAYLTVIDKNPRAVQKALSL